MDIKGQKMLKVCGILLIIFGAIALVTSVISFAGIGSLTVIVGDYAASISGIMWVSMIFSIVCAIVELLAGIFGVKTAGTPSVGGIKASLILGLLMIVLAVVSLILSIIYNNSLAVVYTDYGLAAPGISVLTIVSFVLGLVLPVLYLIGVIQYKNGLLALMGGGAE